MPEPSDNWLTVGALVGTFLAAVVVAFVKTYARERERVRGDAERSPDVAATAVGAAFVDRHTADAIVEIAGEVKAIRDLLRERSEREHDEHLRQSILADVEARIGRE